MCVKHTWYELATSPGLLLCGMMVLQMPCCGALQRVSPATNNRAQARTIIKGIARLPTAMPITNVTIKAMLFHVSDAASANDLLIMTHG